MYIKYYMHHNLLIKIIEEYSDQNKNEILRIKVTTDNKQEITFDNYPIVIMSKDLEYVEYEAHKKKDHVKDNKDEKHGVLDKAKEKALELKDSVIDTTRHLSNDRPT